MRKIAMIRAGVVVNTAVWDGESEWEPLGFVLVDITDDPEVSIGWTYDGADFSPPIQ